MAAKRVSIPGVSSKRKRYGEIIRDLISEESAAELAARTDLPPAAQELFGVIADLKELQRNWAAMWGAQLDLFEGIETDWGDFPDREQLAAEAFGQQRMFA